MRALICCLTFAGAAHAQPMALEVTPEDEFRERLRRAGLATVQVDVWEGRS